jgi:hypothetical protein
VRRRAFLGLASAGFAAERRGAPRPFDFRPYKPGGTLAPVACITPDDGFYIHTFFDICPWSPSGRYLAVLRLPFQNHKPDWRDTADVCVVDLKDRTIRTVYTTSAFGMQTGAQVQWGRTDRFLYFNDKSANDGGHAVAIRLDWQTGKATELAGPMYHLAPDESAVIGFNLDLINHVQDGYGCVVAPQDRLKLGAGASRDQGLWYTDLRTNHRRLLLSLAQIYEALPDKQLYRGLALYLFHTKYNRQGTRIMQVVRARDPQSPEGAYRHGVLVTFRPDGSDIRVAVSPQLWARKGHHPNWAPDGEHILMNLTPGERMRYCLFRSDGSDFRVVSDNATGTGHPSFDRGGRWIVSDAYPGEPGSLADGSVPVWLLDTRRDRTQTVCNMFALGRVKVGVLRLDPHPAWSRDGRQVCFNGAPDGRRQVFIADLTQFLATT